ncbi:BspA family leucine-rich repeat surface protein [Niabella beijingensis]|uniref:BspA family leucine-rich repeat surface protein n=1 Tax=Niabella beijingensis TaxID=2872700 RepID=UPI001CBD6D1D|nr:BspA family leucine-rich repeat surface protein [Niabella beijingensis]MBZ4191826.1 DUF285 domain-containing protein [Niabella beijingensis]
MKSTKQTLAHVLFFVLFLTAVLPASAQAPADWFITEWDLSKLPAGTASIQFPGQGAGYSIEWEQKNNPAVQGALTGNGFTTINFPAAGTIYRVKAHKGTGNFSRFYCGNTDVESSVKALVAVTQWGNTHWTTFDRAFSTCVNLETIPTADSPDLTGVADLQFMFFNAVKFNQPLNFNTATITNMQGMFANAANFNQPLNFNTANVTNMAQMFSYAAKFNQPLNFNTAAVTNMNYMFLGATSFNQPLNFNTAKVTNMANMLSNASSFNQPLNFNTAAVTDMSAMFWRATSFNQNLGHWALPSLQLATFMFENSGMSCVNYTNTLNGWAANTSTSTGVNFERQADMLYSDAAAANGRQKLMNATASGGLGWTIAGDATDNGVCYAQVLPVVFGSISARYTNSTLEVNWQTLSEKNVDFFIVQGSLDGNTWKPISTIPSKAISGNASQPLNYSYTGNGIALSAIGLLSLLLLPAGRRRTALLLTILATVAFGLSCGKQNAALREEQGSIAFIRVAQQDLDGTVTYSKIVKVGKE